MTRSSASRTSRVCRPAGDVVVHVAGGPAEKTRVVVAFGKPAPMSVVAIVAEARLSTSPGVASVALRDSLRVIAWVVIGKPMSVRTEDANDAAVPSLGWPRWIGQ